MKKLILFVLPFLGACAASHPTVQRAEQIVEELRELNTTCSQARNEALLAEYDNPKPFASHADVEHLDAIVDKCFEPRRNELLAELRGIYCPHRPEHELCAQQTP